MNFVILQRTQSLDQSTLQMVKRLIRTYVRPYWGRISIALFFMAISAAMTALFAKMLEPVLDKVLVGQNESLIAPMAGAIFAIFIVNGLSTYIHTVMMNTVGQRIVANIQNDLFGRLVGLDLSFFQDHASGQLTTRMISDVNLMRAAVSDSLTGFGKSFLTLVFLIILMFWQDAILALIAFTIFPIAGGFVAYLGRRLRKISNNIQSETGTLADKLVQVFQGIRQVKAYNREGYERKRAAEAIETVTQLQFKGFQVGNLSTPVNETLLGAALMGVIFYGGHQVVDGNLTVGSLFSFIAAFSLAYEPLKRLAKLNNNLQRGLGAAERVFDMIDREAKITDRPGARPLTSTHAPEITYQNVSFAYGSEGPPALRDISFTVKPGTVTALVGASGSGKTTALNLLPRFFDVTGGCIEIDHIDIRHVTMESLRAHMALVSQDVTIFDDTVRENIAYGRAGATEDDIRKAAIAASADEFIQGLPEGYETRLGENGTRLSGGQKQRIAIARAMLKDAPILLLDEATSALDNESERAIQDSLEQLQKGRTTIVVAHRLSTIQNADQIIVLDQGRIAESGTHKQLTRRNGIYAGMIRLGLQKAS